VTGYQIDSRSLKAGDLFFAIQGERSDGQDFLAEAKEKGALGAVVRRGYAGADFGLELIQVEDVGVALRELATHFVKNTGSQIVGVTGSVGKTTTKDFLATLLEGKYRVLKSRASFNTKLTLPITLLNRVGDEEVLVLEMGMSEPGDIKRLVEIAPPDVAILTKVALAHAVFFPDGIEGIARGKAEIFSSPKLKAAIFPHEFTQYGDLCSRIQGQKLSFSQEERAADYFLSLRDGKYDIDERGVRAYSFDVPFRESHILHNFLASVSAARYLKMSWDEINGQIAKLSLPKMRFEVFEKNGVTFVNDSYNANPESMRAALANLPEPKEGGKRIAVLGSMLELGALSDKEHGEMGRFAQKTIDQLLVLGKEASPLCEAFSEVKKPAEMFDNHRAMSERLKELMREGDVVLIKGSRGMKMETVLELIF
jgi:UDP-N-acetylmuramoyl-tripeptide--D-alanyl-D-alanine ligase